MPRKRDEFCGGGPIPEIAAVSPLDAAAGEQITILGRGYFGITSVTIDDIEAAYVVVDGEHITVTVPVGASLGTITVVGQYGSATVVILGGDVFTVTALKIANYTAADLELVRVDPSGGAVEVTLPAAADSQAVIIKNQSDSLMLISVVADGSDTVDGAADIAMIGARASMTLYSDQTSDWMVT